MLALEDASIKKQLIAGTRWEITESGVSYSSSEYKLQYTFRNTSGFIKSYNTTGEHLLVVPAQESSSFAGGYYTVSVKAISLTNSELIYPIANVVVFVAGDVNIQDSRSFFHQMVEKLETAMLALAEKTMDSVSIDGYSYTYRDMERLEHLAEYYRSKAGIKSDQTPKRRILIQFTNH